MDCDCLFFPAPGTTLAPAVLQILQGRCPVSLLLPSIGASHEYRQASGCTAVGGQRYQKLKFM